VTRAPGDEWAGQQYMARALEDPRTSGEVRRFALRMLRPDHPWLTIDRLREYLKGDDPALRLEAVRTLRESPHPERAALLEEIAVDKAYPIELRAEAIVGIAPDDDRRRKLLLSLAADDNAALGNEALRSLWGANLNATERDELARVGKRDAAAAELVDRVLNPPAPQASASNDGVERWLELLRGDSDQIKGDAAAGARIFFHHKSVACARCHQIAGRGARVGPELTAAAGALAERRLIESILRPAKEIAPQFVSWLVVTKDGQSHVGVLVNELATGEQTYADEHGKLTEFKPGQIETRRPQPTSIMPEGLAGQMTVQEFRDLLAFLRTP
jgi:putative heme-binding domain-containing protein